MSESWTLKGEMTLSCSCTVFCPCVLSLGEHPPTEDRCQTWAGIRIDEGNFDTVDLAGIKIGLLYIARWFGEKGDLVAGIILILLGIYEILT